MRFFSFCTSKPAGGVRAACAACEVSRYILALQSEADGLAYLAALALHAAGMQRRDCTSEPSP